MVNRYELVILLAGCVNAATPATSTQRAAVTLDPTAVPNDGISDRAAIQAAIDAACAQPDGGTVYLGAGRWTVERLVAGPGAYNTHAALALHCHNVTIRGVGKETVLELVGDQGNASVNLISIDPGAEHILIADMTLRCRADAATPCVNTEEQTHAIATSGFCAGSFCLPIRDIKVENVAFDWPRDDPAHRKGDCIRLIGNQGPTAATETTPATPGTRVYGVRISGNDFADCARSSITIQRGVYDAAIAGNTFNATKTCIDGEATGGPEDLDERISITGNAFRPGCTTALSLTSTKGATISGNTFAGRVTLYRSTGVAMTGNQIVHNAVDNGGSIDISNACDGSAVTGNTVVRSGVAGPVVKVAPHSGVICQRLSISGNAITQLTPAWAIYGESVSNAIVADNYLTFPNGAPLYSAIYFRSTTTTAPVTGLAIANNQISGAITNGVMLHASPATIGKGIVVTGNVATGCTVGMRLETPTGFTAQITSAGNAMGPSSYAESMVNHGD